MKLTMQADTTGEGRPIFLVGGGLTGWDSWVPHAKRLSSSRRVTRVQLISVQYGLEGRPLPKDYSLRTESDALSNAIDEQGTKGSNDVVAWSFGAAISLDYALRHPQRIRTLVLIEPPAIWALGKETPRGKEFRNMDEMRRTIKDDITEEQLEVFLHAAGIVPKDVNPRTLPPWPGWVKHRRSLLNTSATMDHMDDPGKLTRFDRPVLLVKGTGSAEFLHQVIDALARQLPNAKVIELPGGHAPQLASMNEFLDELKEFQDGYQNP